MYTSSGTPRQGLRGVPPPTIKNKNKTYNKGEI